MRDTTALEIAIAFLICQSSLLGANDAATYDAQIAHLKSLLASEKEREGHCRYIIGEAE